ncbi:uncharacterized protein VTP21DRAFT_375 [Calcarisporiella thermophila]|uniref:uncharacterized protein n=1 Tax=Calcarisporiella thermophila TaxID=911321 RepID=UPI0037420F2C
MKATFLISVLFLASVGLTRAQDDDLADFDRGSRRRTQCSITCAGTLFPVCFCAKNWNEAFSSPQDFARRRTSSCSVSCNSNQTPICFCY